MNPTHPEFVGSLLADAAEEVMKLREINAELLEALRTLAAAHGRGLSELEYQQAMERASAAIAKADDK